MKKRLPPWRMVSHDPVNRIEVLPRERGGNFEIRVIEKKVLKRDVRSPHCWDREQVIETPHSLSYMLQALKISDKQGAVLDLLQGGLALVIRLSERYSWYLRKAEEKEKANRKKYAEREKKRRERQRAEDARYKAQRRAEEKKKKIEARQEERRKADLERKRLQKEIAIERAEAVEKRAVERAAAKMKRLELKAKREKEAEEKFRADRYWKQDYRRQIEV